MLLDMILSGKKYKTVIRYTFHAEFKMQWPEDKEVSVETHGHGLQDC